MRLSVAVLAVAALVACKKPEAPRAQGGSPAAPVAAAPSAQPIQGKILEKLEAAPYSYLKLQTASGEVWTAVPATQAAVGSDFAVANPIPMQDFESKTLNRKFQVVYFGQPPAAAAEPGHEGHNHGPGEGHGKEAAHGPGDGHDHGAPAQGAQAQMPENVPPAMAAAMAAQGIQPAQMAEQHKGMAAGPKEVKVEKVAKATGADGRTVAEVWAQKAQLKEKSVTVRGQVVKFSPGIMGKNWIHVRDGSGAAEKNDHDLTVTTLDETKVGEVVTVKGLVRVDKDFGAGYAYPVIVEDAKITK